MEGSLLTMHAPTEPLHGVPVGIKDIIDTRDQPTTHGSRAYAGFTPAEDAACVAALREAGAVILGKTVTTEFANRDPGPTSHPLNRLHTPGGSSSGSAAAVADGMVPLALASQTAGSTIRPAAYCGIYGFKPTFGLLSLAGMGALCERFDTLGLYARSVRISRCCAMRCSVSTQRASGRSRVAHLACDCAVRRCGMKRSRSRKPRWSVRPRRSQRRV